MGSGSVFRERSHLWRSRWAAVGAAVAVTFGAGGLFAVGAASPESSVVTLEPVRILDTRDPVNVGLAGPFKSPVAQDLKVTGSAPTTTGTKTVVPTGATGVFLNVTPVGSTAAGFISVRPANAAGLPSTSNVNFEVGAINPNAVLVELPVGGPDDGKIEITFDAFGAAGPTSDVLVDVVGYTTDAKLNALQAQNATQQTDIDNLKAANATQDAYIRTVLLGTALVPSGQTVTGYGTFDHSIIVDNEDVVVAVQLPGRASVPLTSGRVNFSNSGPVNDGDATCTGTTSAPTAPPGKVCIYLDSNSGVDGLSGFNSEQVGFDSQFFLVQGLANGTQGQDLFMRFSWAYTAP